MDFPFLSGESQKIYVKFKINQAAGFEFPSDLKKSEEGKKGAETVGLQGAPFYPLVETMAAQINTKGGSFNG
jgi:hypothetical protein